MGDMANTTIPTARLIELETAEHERDLLRLDVAAKQQQINAFYLGTPETRLLAVTQERDRLRAALIACRPAVERLANILASEYRCASDEARRIVGQEHMQVCALLDTIDAVKGQG